MLGTIIDMKGGAVPGPQPGPTTPPSGGDDDTIDAEFEVKS